MARGGMVGNAQTQARATQYKSRDGFMLPTSSGRAGCNAAHGQQRWMQRWTAATDSKRKKSYRLPRCADVEHGGAQAGVVASHSMGRVFLWLFSSVV